MTDGVNFRDLTRSVELFVVSEQVMADTSCWTLSQNYTCFSWLPICRTTNLELSTKSHQTCSLFHLVQIQQTQKILASVLHLFGTIYRSTADHRNHYQLLNVAWKPNCSLPYTETINQRKHLSGPVICLRHTVRFKFYLIDWLISKHNPNLRKISFKQ